MSLLSQAGFAEGIGDFIALGKFDMAVNNRMVDKGHYLNELVRKSENLELHKHPVWQTLVLYKNKWLGGQESQVADPRFFLSSSGRVDAKKELEATLAAFFSDYVILPTKVSSQCRFPARYYWLKEQLKFDDKRLPEQECVNLKQFYEFLKPNSITLVFPNTHPNSPSSMFGHTLIRFNREGRDEVTNLLDMTITYNAKIPNNIGSLQYMINGLTNRFRGEFSLLPYYLKLREYSQMESRDVWEYKLKVNPEQTRFIMMHAFELAISFFRYKFFTENCSYHLLSLLDVAFPNHKPTSGFPNFTIPIDTIKYLDSRGIIESAHYRPSLTRKIIKKTELLTQEEDSLLRHVVEHGIETSQQKITALPAKRQARFLDVLADMYRHKKLSQSDGSNPKLSKAENQILSLRSKLAVKTNPISISPPSIRPDRGHGVSRYTGGLVQDSMKDYYELEWRPSYHDLLDPSSGFVLNSGLEFFRTRLRFDKQTEDVSLQEFTLLEIQSIEPRHRLFSHYSWHLKLGMAQVPIGVQWQKQTEGKMGIGLSWKLFNNSKNVFYNFLDASLLAGRFYHKDYSLQPGVESGLLLEPKRGWRLKLSANYRKGMAGDSHANVQYDVRQNITINRRWSIGAYWRKEKHLEQFNTHSGLNLHYYGGY